LGRERKDGGGPGQGGLPEPSTKASCPSIQYRVCCDISSMVFPWEQSLGTVYGTRVFLALVTMFFPRSLTFISKFWIMVIATLLLYKLLSDIYEFSTIQILNFSLKNDNKNLPICSLSIC
jgi:hypothetical protein